MNGARSAAIAGALLLVPLVAVVATRATRASETLDVASTPPQATSIPKVLETSVDQRTVRDPVRNLGEAPRMKGPAVAATPAAEHRVAAVPDEQAIDTLAPPTSDLDEADVTDRASVAATAVYRPMHMDLRSFERAPSGSAPTRR